MARVKVQRLLLLLLEALLLGLLLPIPDQRGHVARVKVQRRFIESLRVASKARTPRIVSRSNTSSNTGQGRTRLPARTNRTRVQRAFFLTVGRRNTNRTRVQRAVFRPAFPPRILPGLTYI